MEKQNLEKEKVNVEEKANVENNVKEEKEIKASDIIKSGLKIERSKYVKDNKEYFNYFVKANLRGKEINANLVPSDIGGYELLPIVFYESETIDLGLVPYSITNEKTGEVQSGFTFVGYSMDTDGTLYTTKLRASHDSDKAILNVLFQKNKIAK